MSPLRVRVRVTLGVHLRDALGVLYTVQVYRGFWDFKFTSLSKFCLGSV